MPAAHLRQKSSSSSAQSLARTPNLPPTCQSSRGCEQHRVSTNHLSQSASPGPSSSRCAVTALSIFAFRSRLPMDFFRARRYSSSDSSRKAHVKASNIISLGTTWAVYCGSNESMPDTMWRATSRVFVSVPFASKSLLTNSKMLEFVESNEEWREVFIQLQIWSLWAITTTCKNVSEPHPLNLLFTTRGGGLNRVVVSKPGRRALVAGKLPFGLAVRGPVPEPVGVQVTPIVDRDVRRHLLSVTRVDTVQYCVWRVPIPLLVLVVVLAVRHLC